MDFLIHIDTISAGLPIVHFKGPQVDFFLNYYFYFFVTEGSLNLRKKVQTLMKCSIMLHFVWVFTVCQCLIGFFFLDKYNVIVTSLQRYMPIYRKYFFKRPYDKTNHFFEIHETCPSFFLALCIWMNFLIHIDTISVGLPIVHFMGQQVDFFLNYHAFCP